MDAVLLYLNTISLLIHEALLVEDDENHVNLGACRLPVLELNCFHRHFMLEMITSFFCKPGSLT